MRTIEVRVPRAGLAETLGAMREWLDGRRCALSHFRHAHERDETILISLGFTSIDETDADKFCEEFGVAS